MLKIDKVQLEILINGDPARLKLVELNKEASNLKKEIKATKDEFEKGIKMDKLRDVEKQMEDLNHEIGLLGMTMSELKGRASTLNAIIAKLRPNTPEWTAYKKELTDVKNRMTELNGTAKSHSLTLGNIKAGYIAAVAGIMGFVSSIGGIISNVIRVRSEFEKYEAVLTTSLGSHQKATAAMNMLSEFAQVTNFSLIELTDNFTKFANRGLVLSQEQLSKMADVANATGKSFGQLSEAVLDINNSERWKELGIKVVTTGNTVKLSFKGMTQEVARTEQGVLSAIEKFGMMPGVMGQTAAISKTLGGQISNLGDSWDRLFNSLGESRLGGAIKTVVGWMGSLVDSTRELISIPASEKLEEERINVNQLALSLFDTNLKSEDRKRIMAEINAISPQVIANLDAENFNYTQLQINLEKYNQEMINKIVLQKKDEEVQSARDKAAEARLKISKAETSIRKELNAIVEKIQKLANNNIDISKAEAVIAKSALTDVNKTWEERIEIISNVAKKNNDLWQGNTAGIYKSMGAVEGLKLSESSLLVLRENEQILTAESISLSREREELAKQLGITETKNAKTGKDAGLKTILTEDEKQKAYKKSLDALEQVHNKQLISEKNRYLAGKINSETYNKNIYNLEDIFFEARKKLLEAYGMDTSEIENQIADRKIAKLEADKKAELDVWKEADKERADLEKQINAAIEEEYKSDSEQAQATSESITENELNKATLRKEFESQYLADSYAMQMDSLNQLHADQIISEQEYQNALLSLKLEKASEYLQQSQQILQEGSNAVSAFKDAEITKAETAKDKELSILEEKHSKGLISDSAYNTQKTNIEEKYKKKELEIRKKYAAQEFTMKIAEIVTSQAMAIANVWSKHAWNPILAAIFTAVAIANTAGQIAVARAQYQKTMQAAKGRYNVIGADDGKLYKDVPFGGEMKTGLVNNQVLLAEGNKPELVIDNPTLRNLQYNAPDIIPRIMANRVQQFDTGNYPQNAAPISRSQENDPLGLYIAALANALDRFNGHMDKGIKTEFNMSYFKEVVEPDWNNLKSDVLKS
jgi:hypothetical protein